MPYTKNGITKISLREVYKIINLPPGVEPPQAFGAIGKYWCIPMNLRGNCTSDCTNCVPYFTNINQRLSKSTDVRSPFALYTWLLRDEQGKFADAQLSEKENNKSEIHDPLAALAREFNVSLGD